MTNAFAYHQHIKVGSNMGTLCASIMMREELTEVRWADRSTAVLSARPHPGLDGASSTRAISMFLCLHVMPRSRARNSDQFRKLGYNLNRAKYC